MTEVRRVASFASAGWRSPRSVGTILPSGPALARRLAAVIPPTGHVSAAPVVVEVGAGTGELTPTIVARAGENARVIAVERDPDLAGILRDRGLGVDVIAADAGTLPELLAERGLPGVDAVISALPWALLSPPEQRRMLEVFHDSLHPTGVFTTLAYSCGLWMPSAINFRKAMSALFDEVLPTRTVWFNAPPAMTYVCRRPRRQPE